MSLSTFLWIVIIQTFLSVIIALFAFYKFRRRSTIIRLVGVLFATSAVCNTSALLFREYLRAAINYPSVLYDIVLAVTATLIYKEALNKRYSTVFNIMAALFVFGALLNFIFVQQGTINSFTKTALSFILIIYSVTYFYRLMADLPTVHLHRLPMFWFNSGFLLYGAGALFIFAFVEYIITVLNSDNLIAWTFHNAIAMGQQLLFLAGVIYDLNNSTSAQTKV